MPAVNLTLPVGGVVAVFRKRNFNRRALRRVLLNRAQLRLRVCGVRRGVNRRLDESERAVDHRLADPSAYSHLCELPFDSAETRNRFSELVSLVGVAHRLARHKLHAAAAHRAEFEATDVEDVEGDLVPLADLAEKVLNGRLHVIERERRRGRTLDAHLVLFGPVRQSLLPLDDEARELVAVNFGEDDEHVREAAVRYPHLLALQTVVVAAFTQA